MSPDDPRHGLRAGYIAGCRSSCCTEPNFRYQKRSKIRLQREGTQIVSAAPVVERMAWWADHGVTISAIQAASRVGTGTIRELIAGERDLCLRSTRRAVLAVDWHHLHDRTLCGAALTRTRVQSMLAAGHTLEWICSQIENLPISGRWRYQERTMVGTARAVLAVYDRAPLEGPSKSTAVRSRNRGYLHPLAWEDPGTLAAPSAWTPVPTAEKAPPGRPRVIDAVVEDFDFLVSTGVTEEQAAARLGVRYSTIRDYRLRLEKEAS